MLSAESLEKLSHFMLAFAYFISVTYYLVLLSGFLLNGFGVTDADLARAITTAILAGLGSFGWSALWVDQIFLNNRTDRRWCF